MPIPWPANPICRPHIYVQRLILSAASLWRAHERISVNNHWSGLFAIGTLLQIFFLLSWIHGDHTWSTIRDSHPGPYYREVVNSLDDSIEPRYLQYPFHHLRLKVSLGRGVVSPMSPFLFAIANHVRSPKKIFLPPVIYISTNRPLNKGFHSQI